MDQTTIGRGMAWTCPLPTRNGACALYVRTAEWGPPLQLCFICLLSYPYLEVDLQTITCEPRARWSRSLTLTPLRNMPAHRGEHPVPTSFAPALPSARPGLVCNVTRFCWLLRNVFRRADEFRNSPKPAPGVSRSTNPSCVRGNSFGDFLTIDVTSDEPANAGTKIVP
jgi:hypothetical protein